MCIEFNELEKMDFCYAKNGWVVNLLVTTTL